MPVINVFLVFRSKMATDDSADQFKATQMVNPTKSANIANMFSLQFDEIVWHFRAKMEVRTSRKDLVMTAENSFTGKDALEFLLEEVPRIVQGKDPTRWEFAQIRKKPNNFQGKHGEPSGNDARVESHHRGFSEETQKAARVQRVPDLRVRKESRRIEETETKIEKISIFQWSQKEHKVRRQTELWK